MDYDRYEVLKQYALDSNNYKQWRKIHGNAFGKIFTNAFEDQDEAQIHLTAALIDISQREFEKAVPKLDILKNICFCEFDIAVVNYFTGLNYEMLGNETKMSEHYEELRTACIEFDYPLPFHPYYRTAKFAQRDSECSKAIYYYKRALRFYENAAATRQSKISASHILYDIATVYLYTHQYDSAEHFIRLSRQSSESENQHRDYITAILCAIDGRTEECNALLSNMSAFLRQNCQPMVEAILSGTDPQYCVVPQERAHYGEFFQSMVHDKKQLQEMIAHGNLKEAENIVSEKLTKTLPFMKRKLECRMETNSSKIMVKCKNYFVKSLIAEYEALFSMRCDDLSNWEFISVHEFEHF